MFDEHAITLCGDCYHALVREKHKLEEKLRGYERLRNEIAGILHWLQGLGSDMGDETFDCIEDVLRDMLKEKP